jgi:hypothetical protein
VIPTSDLRSIGRIVRQLSTTFGIVRDLVPMTSIINLDSINDRFLQISLDCPSLIDILLSYYFNFPLISVFSCGLALVPTGTARFNSISQIYFELYLTLTMSIHLYT